jgi:hypothetical protein
MGAVPVPGTSWVRIPLGYRCMRTPGVPDFGQKKNFPVRFWYGSGTGRVGSGTGRAKTPPFSVNLNLNIFSLTFLSHSISRRLVSAPDSLSSTLCLSLPPPPVSSVSALLCSLSLLSVCLCSALGKRKGICSALLLPSAAPVVSLSLSHFLFLQLFFYFLLFYFLFFFYITAFLF